MAHQVAQTELKKLLSTVVEGTLEQVKTTFTAAAKRSGQSIKDIAEGFRDGRGCNALYFAAFAGKQDMVAYFLAEGCEIEAKNDDDESALMIAASNGHADVCQTLIQSKANINSHRKSDRNTPLHLAASQGYEKIVEILLDSKADVEGGGGGELGSPLHAAVAFGSESVVTLLLDRKANISAAGKFSLLHFAAGMGRLPLTSLLVSKKANVDERSKLDNCTALMDAAENGQAEIVSLLLSAKANPDLENDQGLTALDLSPPHVERLLLPPVSIRGKQPKKGGGQKHGGGGAAAATSSSVEKASEEDIKAADKLKDEGNAAFRSGDNETALDRYQQAVKLHPTPQTYSNLSATLLRLKRNSEALNAAKSALALDSNWSKAHYREGEAYFALGEVAEAAASFWEAFRVDPKNNEARERFSEIKERAEREREKKRNAASA